MYSEIASGGMATVCFGRQVGDVGFARTVAIKRLHPHVARDPDFVRMFLDEARLATRIHHAHVVQTLDVVASGGELLLVMEYVHGEALSKLLTTAAQRRERTDPRIAVAIAVGMLEGLHAAHEAKSERGVPLEIVHRDISPQNVIVGLDGVARVFDFGIAKAVDRLHTTQDGSLKGKIAYMSPEQLENEPADRRTDVWAASVVLWEMLANKRLFVADSQAALVRVVLNKDIPKVSSTGAPAMLDSILAKGLARDPAKRYATAREMALALEEALPSASARMVGGWVERNASAELEARAKLLEGVEASAAEERPSGATKVELGILEPEDRTVTAVTTQMPAPEKTAVYARGIANEQTVAFTQAPVDPKLLGVESASGIPLETTRVGPVEARVLRFETPGPLQPTVVISPPRQQIPPLIAFITAALGMIVAGGIAIALFGRSTPKEPEFPPAPPLESAALTPVPVPDPTPTPTPTPVIIAPPATTTAAAVAPATTTAPPATTTQHSPPPTFRPRPPPPTTRPSTSSTSTKKCTPFDFDYPACLKH